VRFVGPEVAALRFGATADPWSRRCSPRFVGYATWPSGSHGKACEAWGFLAHMDHVLCARAARLDDKCSPSPLRSKPNLTQGPLAPPKLTRHHLWVCDVCRANLQRPLASRAFLRLHATPGLRPRATRGGPSSVARLRPEARTKYARLGGRRMALTREARTPDASTAWGASTDRPTALRAGP